MKKRIFYLVYLIVLWIPYLNAVSQKPAASAKTKSTYEDSLLAMLSQSYIPSTIDINRMPINICFIKDREKYVGFVIAGHAFEDICRVASAGVRHFLDSLEYGPNTISSFGVGFDLRKASWSTAYNNKLLELEKTFLDLQEKDYLQVRVSYVPYDVFESMRRKIKNNVKLAADAMKGSNTINRVVFNYKGVNYPLPVAFYNGDSIIKFTIPKSKVGSIPKVKQFEDDLLDKALVAVERSISKNSLALARLTAYDPVAHLLDFNALSYPITYNNGLKDYKVDYLIQFDTTKLVKEYDPVTKVVRRFYSLSSLRTMCNNGITYIDLKNSQGKRINTCEQIDRARETMREMHASRNKIKTTVSNANKSLNNYRYQLLELKSKYLIQKSKNDSTIIIDAFLRGWPFDADNKILNAKLEQWYDARQSVWSQVMAKNPEYRNRLKTKKQLIKTENNIAGIFQFDDVFFSVTDSGAEFIVTPYRLLSGDFVQVVDRANKITHFFSLNNFRLIQL